MQKALSLLLISASFGLSSCTRNDVSLAPQPVSANYKTANYTKASEPLASRIVEAIKSSDTIYSKYLAFYSSPDASLANILKPEEREKIFQPYNPAKFTSQKQELRTLVENLPPSTPDVRDLRNALIEMWSAYAIVTDDFQTMWDANGVNAPSFAARRIDQLKKMNEAGQRFSLLLSDAKKQ
jgi:hypothetical protein